MKPLLILILFTFFLAPAYAEIIYPLSTKEEVQSFIDELNQQGINISEWYWDEKGKREFDKVENIISNGMFWCDGVSGDLKIFKVDINNDGDGEYIKTLRVGSGRFFDIAAIYTEEEGKFRDIYNEIKLPMRKLIRDAENEDYDLEEGYGGFMHGSMIVEKEDSKVYFSMIKASGRWFECDEEGGKWIEDNCPIAYKFLWNSNGIRLVAANKRCLKKTDVSKE